MPRRQKGLPVFLQQWRIDKARLVSRLNFCSVIACGSVVDSLDTWALNHAEKVKSHDGFCVLSRISQQCSKIPDPEQICGKHI